MGLGRVFLSSLCFLFSANPRTIRSTGPRKGGIIGSIILDRGVNLFEWKNENFEISRIFFKEIWKFSEFNLNIEQGYTDLPLLGIEALGSFSIAAAGRKWTGFGRGRPKVSSKNICLMSSGTFSQMHPSSGTHFSTKINQLNHSWDDKPIWSVINIEIPV